MVCLNKMKNHYFFPQLFLRLALGLGFILPVMDRFGWLGAPGTNGNAWGNWSNFVAYTHTLLPFFNSGWVYVMAILATVAETVLGISLILGFKIRLMAFGSFVLTLLFAVCMFCFLTPRAPFNASVFVVSAASLLLSAIPRYRWTVD